MTAPRLALVALLLPLLAPARPAAAQTPDEVLAWAATVILGPEYGGDGKVCSRWVKAPTLSVFGGTDEERAVVADTVKQINAVLADTPLKGIKPLGPGDERADIRVYFAPLADFPKLADRHAFKYVEGNWGYFWTFWNGRREIDRAYVLLASDKLAGKRLRHFALEEITQCLGLMNDSPAFPDSIFYSKGDDGGDAQKLSELDAKLIRFFFTHIQPGDRQPEVRAAFRKHWPKG